MTVSVKHSPWRQWMFRLALCLEMARPDPAEVAAVLRQLGAANARNGVGRPEAEAALSALEIRCGLRHPENATERLDGENVDR